MAAHYTRLPTDDPERGEVAFDFKSTLMYDSPQQLQAKYKSIFNYGDRPSVKATYDSSAEVRQSVFSKICGYVVTAISFILCILTFPVSAWRSFKMVSESDRLVVFRLGRLQGVKGPGVAFILPCTDRVKKVDMRIKAFNVPPLQLITLDAGIIEMGADVHYKVVDAIRSITTVQDLNQSLRGVVRNTLMSHLVKYELQDIEMRKHQIIADVLSESNSTARTWGVDINRMTFSPIKVIQGAQSSGGLPSGLGGQFGGSEDGMSQVFQQLATAFMMKQGPTTTTAPELQVVSEVSDPAGAAVGTDDVKLVPGLSPQDLLTLVHSVLTDTLVRNVAAVYQFQLSGPQGGTFYMDLKHGSGQVGDGPDPRRNPDVTLDLSVRDMQQMFTGSLKPLQAYMSGRLKVSGDLSAALRLEEVFDKVISKMSSSAVGGVHIV